MTKLELAKQLAAAEGTTQTKALSIIENLMDLIICNFIEGSAPVTLRGFGTFKTTRRRGFTTVCPANGKTITVEERRHLTFKPSADLLRRIN